MRNFKLFFFFLPFLLSIFGCGLWDRFTEKTSVAIIQPVDNFRDTREQIDQNTPIKVGLTVLVTTNREVASIPILVSLDGSQAITQYVIPNIQTYVGQVPLYQMGQHKLKVEVELLNGKRASDEVVFVWEEMTGFDAAFLKAAQIFGSQNPTVGLIGISIIATFLLAGFVGIKAKSFSGALIVGFVSIIGVIIIYTLIDPVTGAAMMTSLIGLVGTSILAGVFIYAMSRNYEVKGKGDLYISVTDPSGRSAVLDYKPAARIGSGTSSDGSGELVTIFLDKLTTPVPALPKPEIVHTIDGQLVSEEYFQLARSKQQARRPTRGFFNWLVSGIQRKNQKRLSG